jgi:protein-S-isoprenylcysteine O-methyltransferase Ste14
MTQTAFYSNPFFWALLSMLGMVGASALFSLGKLHGKALYVTVVLVLVTAGRIVLVLPFCPQPRFDMGGWHLIVGGTIFLVGLAVGTGPVLFVRWWAAPEEGMKLRTGGIYSLVRHPIYLCEVLWALGWAVMFCSVYGVALTPVWWLAFLVHALAEEGSLERTLGTAYLDYRKKVRGRIFPGVPF